MTLKALGQRGSYLIHSIILITLLAMLGGMAMMMIMGRAMVVEKVVSTEKGRFAAQEAESRVNDCLQDVTQATCNNAKLISCGFTDSGGDTCICVNGNKVYVDPSWSNPSSSCEVEITVPDPSVACPC